MPVNAQNVLVGAPDQLTTGAILTAPLGTKAPTTPSDKLTGFVDGGYVSEDGVELTSDLSTTDIKDWSGAVVRRILDGFDGTLAWAYLETNEETLKAYAGNVSKQNPTKTTGTILTAKLGAREHERASWAFRIKDGTKKVLIYAPDAQITSTDKVSFKNDAITWPVTLTTYPDKDGNNIYIIVDDGVYAA